MHQSTLFVRLGSRTHSRVEIQRLRHLSAFFPCALAATCLAPLLPTARAQTSGTLIPTAQSYNYSTAPWVITGGAGTYPDGGGVATLGPLTDAAPVTSGAITTSSLINVDVSPTLSQIVENSPFYTELTAGSGTSIIAADTGLTINATTARNISSPVGSFVVSSGLSISAPISGGGTAGLTKTGAGNLSLSGQNTYTGGTHVNGGLVVVAAGGEGDAALGATGAGNGLFFNGGGMVFAAGSGTTSGRDIFLDTGGATFYTPRFAVLNGGISGPGSLTVGALTTGSNDSGPILQGVNTYTGATVSRGGLTLSGAGSILASPSYDLLGRVVLDNSRTNVADRLSDTAPVTLRGVDFISYGNASAASSETLGAVTGVNGFNTFEISPSAAGSGSPGQADSLTVASLARQNNSTFAFRGPGLGGAPGAGVANFYSMAAPTLVGGGGGAGTTNVSILPYAIGNTSLLGSAGAADLVGSSLVTYGANGFRPLATTEYATAFGGNATDNVRLAGATAIPATGVTVNAVLLAPSAASTAAAPVLTGGTINVTSGAFLYSPTSNVTSYLGANLNFGSAEGVLTNTSRLFVPGTISGSNGLTITSPYASDAPYISTVTLSGANTYTGNTTINGGIVAFSGTVGGGAPGAFGTNGTVILNAGDIRAGLAPTAATTFNSPLSVVGTGRNYIAPTSAGYTTTFNGPVSLTGSLILSGAGTSASSAFLFNGTISGPGAIVDGLGGYNVFNGGNPYSGGTILHRGIFSAGPATAFGTGAIPFDSPGPLADPSQAGTLAGVGTTARTIANPLLVNATTAKFTGAAPLTFTGPVNLNGASTINTTNTALTTFRGVVSDGGVSKTGTGAVAFNSPKGNTFTGGFVIPDAPPSNVGANSSAVFANNTSGSAFGAGAISIGAASASIYSTLSGNFSTSGVTSVAGRISPGNGPGLTPATAGVGSLGKETFTTTLTLSSGVTSSLYMEVGAGNTSDEIVVGGALTLAGTVYIASLNSYAIQAGDTFILITAGTLVPGAVTFSTAAAALAPGVSLVETFTGTQLVVSAVPEPGTYTPFAVGAVLAAAGFVCRRRADRL